MWHSSASEFTTSPVCCILGAEAVLLSVASRLSLSELQGLDLSGTPRLGADGCLQLLQLHKRLSRLNLAGCGLRSPLPEAVLQGIGEWLAGKKAVLELAGNQISRTDKLLIATYQD